MYKRQDERLVHLDGLLQHAVFLTRQSTCETEMSQIAAREMPGPLVPLEPERVIGLCDLAIRNCERSSILLVEAAIRIV